MRLIWKILYSVRPWFCKYVASMELAQLPLPFTVHLPCNAVPLPYNAVPLPCNAVPEPNSRKRKHTDDIVDFTVNLPSCNAVPLPYNAVPLPCNAVPEPNSRKHKHTDDIVDFTVNLPSPDATSATVSRKEKIETELKLQCEAHHINYVPPPSHENPAAQKKRRKNLRRSISAAPTSTSVETKLKLQCEAHDINYVPPPSHENPADRQKRRKNLRRSIGAGTIDGIHKIETDLKSQCKKWCVNYISPSENETTQDHKVRIESLRQTILNSEKMANILASSFYDIEEKLKSHCEKWKVPYESPSSNEMLHETLARRKRMRSIIKELTLQDIKSRDSFVICDVVNKMIIFLIIFSFNNNFHLSINV